MNKQLINWRALSRLLTGGSESVRMNRIPEIHKPKVNKLLKLIDQWLKDYE